MPHTIGFRWTLELMVEIRDWKMNGMHAPQIAEIINGRFGEGAVSSSSVNMAWQRRGAGLNLLEKDNEIKIYKDETFPIGDYIVSCDYHAPYYSELWINRLLMIAKKFKIKKHIIIGDLFDMAFASYYRAKDGEHRPSLDEERKQCSPIFKVLDYFDKNILITGNHEARIGNLTDSKIEARHLFGHYGADVWEKKFVYTTADKAFVGDKWLLVHPKSYSQISASVAVRMAEKHHRNILNAHGHFLAMRYDRSGEYLAVDLGGMFDVSKVGYINMTSTTHPRWNQGFGALRGENLHLFHEKTDWDWWLK
jgi:hypothetical protein